MQSFSLVEYNCALTGAISNHKACFAILQRLNGDADGYCQILKDTISLKEAAWNDG